LSNSRVGAVEAVDVGRGGMNKQTLHGQVSSSSNGSGSGSLWGKKRQYENTKEIPSFQPIVITTPPNAPLAIEIEKTMPLISRIQLFSPLFGRVQKGDILVFVNGVSTKDMSHEALMKILNAGHDNGLELTLLWRQRDEQQKMRTTSNSEIRSSQSIARQHFAKVESERQIKIEAMKNEPPPVAMDHFANQAKEKKRKSALLMKKVEPSMASQHFEKKHLEKQASIRIQRRSVRNLVLEKEPDKPLPVNHFTKLGEQDMEEKAKSQRELAHSVRPPGVAYFTDKAEDDKAKRLSQVYDGHDGMSVATKYFNRLALEKETERKRNAQKKQEQEHMPIAIQKFTVAEYEKREKKKAEMQALRDNPPEMSPGTAYFTNQMRDEKERKRLEYQAMRDNPPPSSVASEHFAKERSKHQLEIEARGVEPAPIAIKYFTNKANEERRMQKEASERWRSGQIEASAAVKHFEKQKSARELKIQASRAQIRDRSQRTGFTSV